MTVSQRQSPPSDQELAQAFDELAAASRRLRLLLPRLDPDCAALLAGTSPWSDRGASVLLDIDLWGEVTSGALRDVTGVVG